MPGIREAAGFLKIKYELLLFQTDLKSGVVCRVDINNFHITFFSVLCSLLLFPVIKVFLLTFSTRASISMLF